MDAWIRVAMLSAGTLDLETTGGHRFNRQEFPGNSDFVRTFAAGLASFI